VECETYRLEGHYFGDAMSYMPEEELAQARESEPVQIFRTWLLEQHPELAVRLDEVDAQAGEHVEAELRAALAMPPSAAESATTNVFAAPAGVPAW
jgi:TPP-dependent pyruvate/acetoin dehydrogenase alpha subunit